jgi:hypothetical protein
MDDLGHSVKGAGQSRNVAAGVPGAKRVKALRATDVMPPFDTRVAGDEETAVRSADSAALIAREIPKYDLAENILAEQRRVAAGRRRSPGRAAPAQGPASLSPEPAWGDARPACEPMSVELAELQRVVTEIVARDIERLCRRPERRL